MEYIKRAFVMHSILTDFQSNAILKVFCFCQGESLPEKYSPE
jgi:hypothetical protein